MKSARRSWAEDRQRPRRSCLLATLLAGLWGLVAVGAATQPTAAQATATQVTPEGRVAASVERADRALQHGELQLAESAYRQALLDGWMLLGDLAVAADDLEGAQNAYRAASTVALDFRRPLRSLALAQLGSGDAEEAIATLRGLLVRSPRDADLRRLLAQALVAAGRGEEAILELTEVVDADPEDLESLFTLASGLLRQEEVERARELFDRLASARPIPQTHILIGRTYRDSKQFGLARTELEKALALDPQIRRAHYYLGTVELLDEGKAHLDEAVERFETELSRFPGDPLTSLFLGMAQVESRRFEEALEPLELAVQSPRSEIDGSHFLGRALLALGRAEESLEPLSRALELLDAASSTDPSQIESLHYLRARAHRRLGREDLARVDFEAAKAASERLASTARERLSDYFGGAVAQEGAASSLVPLDVSSVSGLDGASRRSLEEWLAATLARAYLNLGIQQVRAERFGTAARLLTAGAELRPEDATLQRSLAIARFNAGDRAGAVEPLRAVLANDPGVEDLRRMLALSLIDVGAYDQAATLLRDDPGRRLDPALQYAFGLSLVRSGQTSEARQVFDRLLSENTEWAELQVLLGQASAQEGDYPTAIAAFERALAIDPEVAEANASLGMIYLRQGELEAAESALVAELAHHPADHLGRYHLATVLDLLDRSEEAADHLERVLAAQPSDADARYLLGKIRLGQGAVAEAVAQLEAASELSPTEPNIHYQLGQAYQRQGRAADARLRFERFRELKKVERGESP